MDPTAYLSAPKRHIRGHFEHTFYVLLLELHVSSPGTWCDLGIPFRNVLMKNTVSYKLVFLFQRNFLSVHELLFLIQKELFCIFILHVNKLWKKKLCFADVSN